MLVYSLEGSPFPLPNFFYAKYTQPFSATLRCASQFQCNVFYTKQCCLFNSSYNKHMVFTTNKPETNAKIPGMPEEEACAWRIC